MKNLEMLLKELSLKKVTDSVGACYQYCLKASKLPKKDEVYDPEKINYAEVEKILMRKNPNYLTEIDWDEIIASNVKVLPKEDASKFVVGSEFSFRNNELTFKVIYKTETHVVFIDLNEETTPRVMNFDTFIHQSPRIIVNEKPVTVETKA